MWFKCVICQLTYSHKCNLKRHMDTAHLHKVHRCNLCDKEFKRMEYLTRHLKQAHKTSSNSKTFSQIADCFSTEQSPVRDFSSSNPASDLDDVDTFLNSLEDITIEATQTDACFTTSSSAPHIPSLSQVSVCTQTDVCALPSIRHPHTTGTNTTPIFTKDKSTQKGIQLVEGGYSPHCRIVSPNLDIQGWDSPVINPPELLDGTYLDITLLLIRRKGSRIISLKPPPTKDPLGRRTHSHLTSLQTHLSGV